MSETTLVDAVIATARTGDVYFGVVLTDEDPAGIAERILAKWDESYGTVSCQHHRWVFTRSKDDKTIFLVYAAKHGIKGVKLNDLRPTLAIVDDIQDNEVKHNVLKSLHYALHPLNRKIIEIGATDE